MTKQQNMPLNMLLGPVMLDVQGTQLSDEERETLCHPLVGGVIMFARNYQSRGQMSALIADIKALRTPQLLIAVDQEGGRVQRFKDEFTRLPAAEHFGQRFQADKQRAPIEAFESAQTMARELVEIGIDFSFAPVFDVNSQDSEVIGDRCFHPDPNIATELLGAYIDGMRSAGMVAIAKHFPGHGGVSGDSHHCLPCDQRELSVIQAHDILPYTELGQDIQGVMTAHVLFEQCDQHIPTYSKFWLKTVLREQIGFQGVVFSDDLCMQGAVDIEGSIVGRAELAIAAGCEMLLVCNRPDLAKELLQGFDFEPKEQHSAKLTRLSANLAN